MSNEEGIDHLNQIISTMIMTIKQVLYARATELQNHQGTTFSSGNDMQGAHPGHYSQATAGGPQATEMQMETLVIFTMS